MNNSIIKTLILLKRRLLMPLLGLALVCGNISHTKAQNLRIDPASIANLPDTVQFGDTLKNLSVQVVNDGQVPVANFLIEIKGGFNNLTNVITFGDTLLSGPLVLNPGDSITIPLDQFVVSPQNSNNGSNIIIVWPGGPNGNGDTTDDGYYAEETATALVEALNRSDELRFWPNPVNETLQFDFSDAAIITEGVQIRNMQGQVILSRPGRDKSLDVSGLPEGMYILEIKGDEGVLRAKPFLKQ